MENLVSKKKYFLVFDTETTGLLPSNPYIVSIAWKVYVVEPNNDLAMIHSSYYIVKVPENVIIPDESIAIHNISTERSREYGIEISKVIEKLNEVFNTWTFEALVAHNIKFDINVLILELKRQQNNISNSLAVSIQNTDLLCTCILGKDIAKIPRVNNYRQNQFKNYKLPKLVELHKHYFNNTDFTQHNAEGDTFACARCFFKMKYNKDITYDMSF